jgi:hypothetical protein
MNNREGGRGQRTKLSGRETFRSGGRRTKALLIIRFKLNSERERERRERERQKRSSDISKIGFLF